LSASSRRERPTWAARLGGLAVVGALVAPEARADQLAARICTNGMIEQAQAERWRLKANASWDVDEGSSQYMLVSLQSDIQYQLVACGDAGVALVSIVLYDLRGNLIMKTEATGPNATLEFSGVPTMDYFAGVRLVQVTEPVAQAAIAAQAEHTKRSRWRRRFNEPAGPSAAVAIGLMVK
jgi:hypothetical protein